MIKEYFKLALNNIKYTKFRSFLTIIGIAIGITSVISIISLGESSKEAIVSELDKMGIKGINIKQKYEQLTSNNLLKIDDVLKIEKYVNEVECAVPIFNAYGVVWEGNKSKQAFIRGVDGDISNFVSSRLLYGRMINSRDTNVERNVVVIDENLAKQLFRRKNVVGRKLKVGNEQITLDLQVIGVIENTSDLLSKYVSEKMPAMLYMPVSLVQKMEAVDNIDYIAVKVSDKNDHKQISNKIINYLERIHNIKDTYYAENMSEQKKSFNSILRIFTISMSSIAGISLLVAGFGIMNIMLVTVNERTSEIGIRKALGAKKQDILIQFICEAVILTMIGGIIGLTGGIGLFKIISHLTGLPFIIRLWQIIICLIFSVIMGLVFGIFPAYKASKLLPVDALRCE